MHNAVQFISLCIIDVFLQVQWHPRSSQTRVCKVCQPLPHEPPRPGQRPDRCILARFLVFPASVCLPRSPLPSNSALSLTLSSWTKMCITHLSFYYLEYLKVRSHDPEEAIRHDVIVTIINAGKKDLNLVNDQLLGFVRERTLDKRVRQIRYHTVYGMTTVQTLLYTMVQEFHLNIRLPSMPSYDVTHLDLNLSSLICSSSLCSGVCVRRPWWAWLSFIRNTVCTMRRGKSLPRRSAGSKTNCCTSTIRTALTISENIHTYINISTLKWLFSINQLSQFIL